MSGRDGSYYVDQFIGLYMSGSYGSFDHIIMCDCTHQKVMIHMMFIILYDCTCQAVMTLMMYIIMSDCTYLTMMTLMM